MINTRQNGEKASEIEKKVYTVRDIQIMLSLSRNGAYDFINSMKDTFGIKRIGTAIRVPKQLFDDWLNQNTVIEGEINYGIVSKEGPRL